MSDWSQLRLRDRIAPGVRLLFVGINPGVRSAVTGHSFAGFSNRFWRVLRESKLVPEPITYEDNGRLVGWQLGITNLIARPSPGINDLRPAEYVEGWKIPSKKSGAIGRTSSRWSASRSTVPSSRCCPTCPPAESEREECEFQF